MTLATQVRLILATATAYYGLLVRTAKVDDFLAGVLLLALALGPRGVYELYTLVTYFLLAAHRSFTKPRDLNTTYVWLTRVSVVQLLRNHYLLTNNFMRYPLMAFLSFAR